ncbi:hypothetical protein L209DRAFT_300962 [Thermothelomyces heterothallicus CBS 203.75]
MSRRTLPLFFHLSSLRANSTESLSLPAFHRWALLSREGSSWCVVFFLHSRIPLINCLCATSWLLSAVVELSQAPTRSKRPASRARKLFLGFGWFWIVAVWK